MKDDHLSYENFFHAYAALNENTEIPKGFSAWCGLAAISAMLARRCYLDMGTFTIYPNMYLVLIAGSGNMRKSTSIGVTKKLLAELDYGPNLVSQKVTTEQLLQELRTGVKTIEIGKKSGEEGQGYLCADEFTNFLNQATIQSGMNPLLTELYDCNPRFSYGTISRGKEVLSNTQLGILAATTPEELHKAVPREGIGSGLASRIIFVYEDRVSDPIAFPTYTDEQLKAREFCLRFLQRISGLSGKVTLPKPVKEWFEECYIERCHKSELFKNKALAGYASRRFIHILKLSTIISAGRTETLSLSIQSGRDAEALLLDTEKHLHHVVQLVMMNEKGSITQQVLSIILQKEKVQREELLKMMIHVIDTRELTEIIGTLVGSGLVKTKTYGSAIFYVKAEFKD